MKPQFKKDEHHKNRTSMKNKNMKRLGGGGLSLEAFANAKTKNNDYNPAAIKKQREFYKNAKCVNQYKKTLKQQGFPTDTSSSFSMHKLQEGNETRDSTGMNRKNTRSKKPSGNSLKQLYDCKHEEQEKARNEREAVFQAKKEGIEKAESKRKEKRKKMLKKTRSHQPIMKYRIENLLEIIQASANKE